MLGDYRRALTQSKGKNEMTEIVDHGPGPFVVNIEDATLENENFRTALWTGKHLQMTVMNIPVGGDIGLEIHHKEDQFLRVEQGRGLVRMGPKENEVTFEAEVEDDWVILIPVGVWHNVINIGDEPLKVYSIYGPPHHKFGTTHKTQADDVD